MPALFLLLALAQAESPLSVTLRAGPKTHGPGEHDHPAFLERWSALLAERGARVQGGLAFPDEATLAATDVLVIYAAEGGAIHGEERARLERYLARGGGIAVLHDGVSGDDPQWFQGIIGGAWEHGRSRWHTGEIGLCFADREHPITRGAENFDFQDEIYWDLHVDPRAHVLANAFHTPFDVTPQAWVFEPGGYRAFVALQGHYLASFDHPAWRTLLLRGIAWAGGREADLLVTPEEIAGLCYPPGGPRSPESSAEAFVLEPGFEIELVAAEPLVVNPIAIDWDEHGEPWVACTPGYPDKEASSGIAARDFVARLVDRDGDGKSDGSEPFAEGLDLVSGLVLVEGGAIVSAAPHILWLPDREGAPGGGPDGRADRAEILYTGFGFADTHAVISNLVLGHDGWVYAVQGYSGAGSNAVMGFATEPRPARSFPLPPGGWGLGMDAVAARERGGLPQGRIPGGVFRFRPDGSAAESVAIYGSNTWGLDLSPSGEFFFSMANGSHLRHLVLADAEPPGGRLAGTLSWVDAADHDRAFGLLQHDRPPYQQIDFVGGFTAAAGCLIQDGGAFPEAYDGNAFVCEPTLSLVHRDVLAPAGVTYRASSPGTGGAGPPAEFLASRDLWFRPVHLRSGPDGALYVLDFYNQAVVHNDTRGPPHGPTNAALRPDRDHAHGRIWRVRHAAARPAEERELARLAGEDLLAELGSANGWRRRTALRLLREGRAPSLDTVLQFSHQAADPRARLAALWLLDALDADEASWLAALEDPHPDVRWNAARILGRRALGDEPPDELWMLLLDENPRVVLEALCALARYPGSMAQATLFAELGLELAEDWSRSALLGVFARDPARLLEACLAQGDPASLATIAREAAARAAQAGDEAGIARALARCTRDARSAPPELVEDLLAVLSRELAPQVRLDAAGASLSALLADPHRPVALAALALASRCTAVASAAQGLAVEIAAWTGDSDLELGLRMRALEALLALPTSGAEPLLAAERFLDPFFPLETQLAALDGLARAADTPEREALAAHLMVSAFPLLSHPARQRIFQHLSERPERLGGLLDAVDAGSIAARELGPLERHRLTSHPDAAIAERARALFAPAQDRAKEALLAELLPRVDAPGDAAAGAVVFRENCAVCHVFDSQGGRVGPDLTGMGAHGKETLLSILLDPNREIDPAYLEYAAETADGRVLTGVLVHESATEVTLRSSAGDARVRREELASLASLGRSPMPEGFESLGATALCDLLAYLAGGYQDFRVIDLSLLGTTSTNALYDKRRDARPMRFRATGVVNVAGVPFEILDPARVPNNALALKGGLVADWDSKLHLPRTVRVPVGFALERLHVLGGIAAWGYPYTSSREPAVRLTWIYADGEREELVLKDGERFADWIARHDVPGSEWVDLLEPESPGQVRRFTLDPSRPDVPIAAIELASLDNHLSPTFLALTAQLRGAAASAPVPAPFVPPTEVRHLIFGGGTSHDYPRWFQAEDLRTLAATGAAQRFAYSELSEHLTRFLPQLEALTLCNNQALAGAELRKALFDFVDAGGGLCLLHAATWYNWPDWPEYNRNLVGGGARSHEPYAELRVTVIDPDHPLMRGVAAAFTVADELYRFEADPVGAPLHVLATATSATTGATYPVAWTVERGGGRVFATTLGHDGAAHAHRDFQTLLRNAAHWLAAR